MPRTSLSQQSGTRADRRRRTSGGQHATIPGGRVPPSNAATSSRTRRRCSLSVLAADARRRHGARLAIRRDHIALPGRLLATLGVDELDRVSLSREAMPAAVDERRMETDGARLEQRVPPMRRSAPPIRDARSTGNSRDRLSRGVLQPPPSNLRRSNTSSCKARLSTRFARINLARS